MSSEYYDIPPGVISALTKNTYIQGKIFVPWDPQRSLTTHLSEHGFDVTSNDNEENLYSQQWWHYQKQFGYDWTICSTLGLKESKNYVLTYGLEVAKEGIAILDRLSFLEPVESRRDFLLVHKMSQMVILSPRPRYSVVTSARDSMTSAWFLFQHPDKWRDMTQIIYAVNWDAKQKLQPLGN